MKITFPDGNQREFADGMTIYEEYREKIAEMVG